MIETDEEWMRKKLTELYDEHRRLDEIIQQLGREAVIDPLAVQRMKKQKLRLKDQIQQLENTLLPDIIA